MIILSGLYGKPDGRTSAGVMYLCTGFRQNTLAEYASGYIVGTSINSD